MNGSLFVLTLVSCFLYTSSILFDCTSTLGGCNGHGTCNEETKDCECNDGDDQHQGYNCNLPSEDSDCTANCYDPGTFSCVGETCNCNDEYAGTLCNLKRVEHTCEPEGVNIQVIPFEPFEGVVYLTENSQCTLTKDGDVYTLMGGKYNEPMENCDAIESDDVTEDGSTSTQYMFPVHIRLSPSIYQGGDRLIIFICKALADGQVITLQTATYVVEEQGTTEAPEEPVETDDGPQIGDTLEVEPEETTAVTSFGIQAVVAIAAISSDNQVTILGQVLFAIQVGTPVVTSFFINISLNIILAGRKKRSLIAAGRKETSLIEESPLRVRRQEDDANDGFVVAGRKKRSLIEESSLRVRRQEDDNEGFVATNLTDFSVKNSFCANYNLSDPDLVANPPPEYAQSVTLIDNWCVTEKGEGVVQQLVRDAGDDQLEIKIIVTGFYFSKYKDESQKGRIWCRHQLCQGGCTRDAGEVCEVETSMLQSTLGDETSETDGDLEEVIVSFIVRPDVDENGKLIEVPTLAPGTDPIDSGDGTVRAQETVDCHKYLFFYLPFIVLGFLCIAAITTAFFFYKKVQEVVDSDKYSDTTEEQNKRPIY